MVAETQHRKPTGPGKGSLVSRQRRAPAAEWVEWTVQEGGYSEFFCSEKTTGAPNPAVNEGCLFSVNKVGEDAEVTAVFNEIPPPNP